VYHPGCDCERCSLETHYRHVHGIPLDAGFGTYLGLDSEAFDRDISLERERAESVDSIHGGHDA